MSGTSKRENKSVYQLRREELGWSRSKASEMTFISENRLEKIEIEKTPANPDDIIAMAEAYKMPELCNHYCVNECSIGKQLNIPLTEQKGLAAIVLEVLTTLSSLEKEKERFIEIAKDEKISEDELVDFFEIQSHLESISSTVDSLKLWISKASEVGKLNKRQT